MGGIILSPKDRRYLAFQDGRTFIPLGLNLCFPRQVTTREKILEKMFEWMEKLTENGGNFFRLWLSHPAFAVEKEREGKFEKEYLERIQTIVEKAKKLGLWMNVCLEHFRSLQPQPDLFPGAANFGKPLHHRDLGGSALSMDDFWTGEASRKAFLKKLDFYQSIFAKEPALALWELWNEINAVEGRGFEDWTRRMLGELKKRFPERITAQSLGGWEYAVCAGVYRTFIPMPHNEITFVHRYLNTGGDPDLSQGPMDVISAGAISDARREGANGPILLGEGGAVEPHHAGPWSFYPLDLEGVILHDVLFAPFFSGSAGAGMIWHWDYYVAKNNLWHHFSRFKRAIRDFDPVEQSPDILKMEHPDYRIYVLAGRSRTLIWIRDRENDWENEFTRGVPPRLCSGGELDLSRHLGTASHAGEFYDPWTDSRKSFSGGPRFSLPPFKRSLVIRLGFPAR